VTPAWPEGEAPVPAKPAAVYVAGKRTTRWDPAAMWLVAEAVAAAGAEKTLAEICNEDDRLPSWPTVRRWTINRPEAAAMMERARALSAYAIEDQANTMAQKLAAGAVEKDQIRAYDVALQHFRWAMAVRNRRVYDTKFAATTAIGIKIETTLDLGGPPTDVYNLSATVPAADEPPTIDGTAEPFAPERSDDRARGRGSKKSRATRAAAQRADKAALAALMTEE